VQTHVSRILAKLGLRSRGEVIHEAAKRRPVADVSDPAADKDTADDELS
jgi:hypothetical protein